MSQDIHIVCPNLDKFIIFFKKTSCPNMCHENGFCSDGKCICYEGYEESTDCRTKKNILSSITSFTTNLK